LEGDAMSEEIIPIDRKKSLIDRAKAGLYELTTLGKLGRQLPIGLLSPDGSKLSKSFTLRPFTFEEELAVGEMREQQGLSAGAFVAKLMSIMTIEVGGTRLEDLKDDASRELFFHGMFMADVLYMYVCLRIEAMSNTLSMLINCPGARCQGKEPFPFYGDLNGIDVRAVQAASEIDHTCTLRDGLKFGDKVHKALRVQPPRWNCFYERDLNNKAQIQLAMFTGSVVGFADEDGEVSVPETCFRKLSKFDAEKLSTFISKATPGPQMILEAVCPKCKTKGVKSLDWGYDSFFAGSSLSDDPTT
jgi:hypothetical protein